MLQAAIQAINTDLTNLSWMERYGGLVQRVTKVDMVDQDSGLTTNKSFPIAGSVDGRACWEQGRYADLVPNSNYTSLAYWEQLTPVIVDNISGAKDSLYRFQCRARLVVWLNLQKLGITSSAVSDAAAFQIIQAIEGKKTLAAPLDNFQATFDFYERPAKDPALFSRYSYEEEVTNLGLYPYDYFALDFTVRIYANMNCDISLTTGAAIDCVDLSTQ
jgi:hypothetical protein